VCGWWFFGWFQIFVDAQAALCGLCVDVVFSTESLILAQDERWRRA
jgi:hypothetical protein